MNMRIAELKEEFIAEMSHTERVYIYGWLGGYIEDEKKDE